MKTALLLSSLILISGCGDSSDKGPLKFSTNEIAKIDPVKKPDTTPPPEKPDTPVIVEDKTYTKLKTDLFDKSCTGCHNPKRPKRMDLTSKENIIKNTDDIVYRMTDAFDMGFDYMPPKGDPVKPELIALLKEWKKSLAEKAE